MWLWSKDAVYSHVEAEDGAVAPRVKQLEHSLQHTSWRVPKAVLGVAHVYQPIHPIEPLSRSILCFPQENATGVIAYSNTL